jgi:hypothetical protein
MIVLTGDKGYVERYQQAANGTVRTRIIWLKESIFSSEPLVWRGIRPAKNWEKL